ncbi:acyl-CoA synthetase [Aureimonas endophytica]|uniref:Acyl-CoA synthetase n=1 Tax=Aureimonas endophytica TaxID=2027858 RepID=A0A917E6U3_9HYPH|nr:AMP-binding protein [Aureimonas endophytica]GGE10007.1 acyl-CoA synthetase [Aureimonas endophytica]
MGFEHFPKLAAERGGYAAAYARWKADPLGFWMERALLGVDWFERPRTAFDPEAGPYGRWFPDGICNTCHNALDRHVAAGRGERVALIHDSPVTGTLRRLTYAGLLREVKAFAATLAGFGIGKGDRVVIYMPMVPETAIAMLACARLGAIHSVVFGGFAARELAHRIDDVRPKLIVTASCGIEPSRTVAYKPLADRALELARHPPGAMIVLQRPQLAAELRPGRDHDWHALQDAALAAGADVPCTPLAATDPLYVLYTSGTTGRPKGVVRDNGGHMVAIAYALEAVYGVKPGETFFAASDLGWVVGHSFIVYGPLVQGGTGILYEGKPVGTPDAGAFWRLIAEHGAVSAFTAPSAVRAIRREDPDGLLPGRYDLSRFRALFVSGEHADAATVDWARRALGKPVLDQWWQTEIGWPIAANPLGLGILDVPVGQPGVAMPGHRLDVLGPDGTVLPPGRTGTIALRLPLAPGALPTLWNADSRFRDTYLAEFPGYYSTSDAGRLDASGIVSVLGRTDDVINVSGHRLSTGEMEDVVAAHPAVAECAVVGAHDELKGAVPVGFVVPKLGIAETEAAIREALVAAIREAIGPVAAFRRVVFVARLPKTRSGKVLRGTLRQILDGTPFEVPATIEDPAVLPEIAAALATGMPQP